MTYDTTELEGAIRECMDKGIEIGQPDQMAMYLTGRIGEHIHSYFIHQLQDPNRRAATTFLDPNLEAAVDACEPNYTPPDAETLANYEVVLDTIAEFDDNLSDRAKMELYASRVMVDKWKENLKGDTK